MKKINLVITTFFIGLTINVASAQGTNMCWHGKYSKNTPGEGFWRNGLSNTGTHFFKGNNYYVKGGYITCCRPFKQKSKAQQWSSECARYYNKYYNSKGDKGAMCWSQCVKYNGH